jgi:AcrR family transcriptional regulator
MSTVTSTSSSTRHTELSRRVILDAALELLETVGFSRLTMRAVSRHAGVAERTVFRYFATRDEFLDAIADAASLRLSTPPPPRTIDELRVAPHELYRAFETRQGLVSACTHPELADRIRASVARTRWSAVRKLVDEHAPHAPVALRKVVATNICYYLIATTWNYYRFHFKLSLADTIACAESAIAASLDQL